jgi:hypothetical protein
MFSNQQNVLLSDSKPSGNLTFAIAFGGVCDEAKVLISPKEFKIPTSAHPVVRCSQAGMCA